MSRTAVVTGVTSGIGAALAHRLIAADYSVIGLGRDAARMAEFAEAGGHAVLVDLSDPPARASAMARIRDRCDAIDLLVNNAAAIAYAKPLDLPVEEWRFLLEVNLLAVIDLCQGLVSLLGGDGQVVNISSVSARYLANCSFAPYGLTKVALDRFSEALRLQLSERGVRVATVTPGLVDTPIYKKVSGFEGTEAKIRSRLPVWLSAEDVAEAVVWIAGRPAHVDVADLVLLPRGQAR